MSDRYTQERDFRLKILALLLDPNWISKYGISLIRPEYFELEDEELLARAILDYHKAYKRPPQDSTDVIALTSIKYADTIETIFDLYESGDLSLASDVVVAFAKAQAMKLSLLESVDDVNRGDYNKIVARFKEASKVGEDITANGIDPIADVKMWLYDYWKYKVRTGMYHLDNILEGGLDAGELGVIIAPPNRGKSMALINIAAGATFVGNGKNVVYFTHEMKAEQVSKRYAARITFRFPSREDDLAIYEDNLLNAARKFYPGRLRIIYRPHMSFESAETHLSRLKDDGFNIGLIIDDYPDLMQARRHYSERRFELSSIYEGWRELANMYGCPVWVASQSSRGSLSKEIVTMADIAEDIGKANIADVMVAICQTREELMSDTARLFMAKVRDGSTKVPLISCKWYSDSQAIITTGFVNRKEESRDA